MDPRAAKFLQDLQKNQQEILAAVQAKADRDDAYERFERGLPMTERQVCVVLTLKPHGANYLVSTGKLKRRWPARAGFHPDDVKSYLKYLECKAPSATAKSVVVG